MSLFGKGQKESEEGPEEEKEAARQAADEAQIKIWQEEAGIKEESKKEEGAAEPEKPKEETIESLKEKVQDYRNQILRLQADFANFRKRAEKEKGEAIRFGREVILERMIGLSDVMENALKHSQNAKDLDSLKKGFEMVTQEFSRFLKSEGAEPLRTVGKPFDPNQHEAVEQVGTENEKENDTVLEELQKGYTLNGRLLRTAKVKVAKFKEEKKDS